MDNHTDTYEKKPFWGAMDMCTGQKPLVYWANRLCDALEKEVIDEKLVIRCIAAIREYS